jgi:serine/threonine protein kinase
MLCRVVSIFFIFVQISDFGLAKLVVKSNDAEASVTKVVGTFGYLAPE